MKIHTDNLLIRFGGTMLAFGWAGFGAFSLSMTEAAPTPHLADRALWFGITLLFAAAVALPVTWLVKDLSNIWCIPPRKSRNRRLDRDAD
jgi:hypothetical protein